MARTNDNSCYSEKWSYKKLLREIRRTANLEDFGGPNEDEVRENTELYRNTWLNPLIDELERRLIK